MASQTEQVWQTMGTNKNDDAIVVGSFNWIWRRSRFKTTAAQRADLATCPWTWQDLATYPTII